MLTNLGKSEAIISNDEELYRKYLTSLDHRLLDIMKQSCLTFSQVASNARGAFPTLVLERLKVLGIENELRKEPSLFNLSKQAKIFPELHPLDFEWYFTNECADQLSDILNSYDGATLCLGAPTVATSIAHRKRNVYLADNNALLDKRLHDRSSYLQFMLWDLCEPLPLRRTFPKVFFDAPWYSELINLWLWQAARAIQPNGLIAFSLFPSLLRPMAEHERVQILSFAERLGRVEVKEDFLEYETPLFEKEALLRSGIKRISNWRHGDLVLIYSVQSSNGMPPPSVSIKMESWDSFVIGSQVVKLRNPTHGNKEVTIKPLDDSPDYVYSSVSLRDPRRDLIDLWTSRNRVARVGKRGVLLNILRHLSSGLSIDEVDKLPIMSFLNSEERESFLSDLRLILDKYPDKFSFDHHIGQTP